MSLKFFLYVGSAAIHYICAKPILDIAIRFKSIEDMDIDAIQELGYEFCGSRNKEKTYYLNKNISCAKEYCVLNISLKHKKL